MNIKERNFEERNRIILEYIAGRMNTISEYKNTTESQKEEILLLSALALENHSQLPNLLAYENVITKKQTIYSLLNDIIQTIVNEKTYDEDNKKEFNNAFKSNIIIEMLSYCDLLHSWKSMSLHISYKISDSTLKRYGKEIESICNSELVKQMVTKNKERLLTKYDEKTFEKNHDLITQLMHTIEELKSENSKLRKENSNKTLFNNEASYSALNKIISNSLNNMNKEPNGRRYLDDKDVYLVYYLLGKKTYKLSEYLLHFPSKETIRRYKKQKLKELFGVNAENPNLFNGNEENIKALIDAFFPKDSKEEQKRVVLAIDAASVRANITVDEKGKVTGLINDLSITPEEAKDLIESEKKFKEFCVKHLKEATQAIFVILFIPLDPDLDSFPICEIAATSGNATKEIVEQLEKIKSIVCKEGFDVVGYGCDGDPQYLIEAKIFIECCLTNLTARLNEPIIKNFQQMKYNVVFYDALHLGKNNRYYYSTDSVLFIWVNSNSDTFSKQDFIEIGISEDVFEENKNKMDDNLALKLFTFENIERCIAHNKMTLALALLPTTLLFKAVFGDITRNERIEYLSVGFCLILLYSYEAKVQEKSNHYTQMNNRSKKSPRAIRAFPESFCCKYLELTYNLINQLSINTPIHLGSLGSHKLEHLFGLIRRLTFSNYSPQAFDQTIRNVILYKALCKSLNCGVKIEKRKSDSGSRLEKDDVAPVLLPIGVYISSVFCILKECNVPLICENFYNTLNIQYSNMIITKSIYDFVNLEKTVTDSAESTKDKNDIVFPTIINEDILYSQSTDSSIHQEKKEIIDKKPHVGFNSFRKQGLGVANSINQKVTHIANEDSIKKMSIKETLPNIPQNKRVTSKKTVSSAPKTFVGTYEKKKNI